MYERQHFYNLGQAQIQGSVRQDVLWLVIAHRTSWAGMFFSRPTQKVLGVPSRDSVANGSLGRVPDGDMGHALRRPAQVSFRGVA